MMRSEQKNAEIAIIAPAAMAGLLDPEVRASLAQIAWGSRPAALS
jgi:hypothetical protein